jgi:type IV secretion system protein VirB4
VAREAPAGRHLPYSHHIDDHTVATRDGLLMQVIAMRGLLFETADTDEINYRKRLRDAMLQAIGSSRFALYHHIVRRRVEARLDGRFDDPFSAKLDAAWQRRQDRRQLFVNDLYLTLVRRPLQGRVGLLDGLREKLGHASSPAETTAHDLRQLDTAREALMAALGSYAPTLLSVYEGEAGLCSEPLEFLSTLFNGESRPVLLPTQDIGAYLPDRRISFGQETIELGPSGASDRSYLGLVSIKDYPGQTSAGMFDELLRLPFELTISQSFGFVERQAALGRGRGGQPSRRTVERQGRGRRGPIGVRRASYDDRRSRRLARRGRCRRRRSSGRARRSRHYRDPRGDRARACLLGAVPRQFQIYRAARPRFDGQFRGAGERA